MLIPANGHRFRRQSARFRRRFGTRNGIRIADDITNVTNRQVDRPIIVADVLGWREPFQLRHGTTDIDAFLPSRLDRELYFDVESRPRRTPDSAMLSDVVVAHS